MIDMEEDIAGAQLWLTLLHAIGCKKGSKRKVRCDPCPVGWTRLELATSGVTGLYFVIRPLL